VRTHRRSLEEVFLHLTAAQSGRAELLSPPIVPGLAPSAEPLELSYDQAWDSET
jgi:hypothetical protein